MAPHTVIKKTDITGRSPRWKSRRPLGKVLPDGTPEPGQPIIIHCDHRDLGPGLCESCRAEFRLVLADVGPMRRQLAIAAARGARFVEHGSRRSQVPRTRDESPLPWFPQASDCQAILGAILAQSAPFLGSCRLDSVPAVLAGRLTALAGLPALVDYAHKLSAAMARAARIIDSPPDLFFYGLCPNCDHELWQERVTDDSDHAIQCRCGYSNSRDAHSQMIIDRGEDAWLTVGELVAAVTMAGQPITRHQVNWWVRHDGLAREERARVRWVDGDLVTTTVSAYRLGDVRARALGAEIRRRS